jgi:hypothetical protein
MMKPLAVCVRHCLGKLADQGQALLEVEVREALAKVSIEASSFGVILKNKSRPKLSLAIIECTLNASMFDPLHNTEFPLSSARESITSFRCRRTCVRIHADASANARRRVTGCKVLPVFSFPEQLPKFIIPNAPTPARRPNPSLLDRAHPGPGRCWIWRAAASKSIIGGSDKGPNYSVVVRASWYTSEHGPLLGTSVQRWRLRDG